MNESLVNERPPSADRDHRNDRHADDVIARRPDNQHGPHVEPPHDRSPDHADAPSDVRWRNALAYSDQDLLQLLRSRVHRYSGRAHDADGRCRDNRRGPYVEPRYDRSPDRGRADDSRKRADWGMA